MLKSLASVARFLRRSYVLLAIGMLLLVLVLPGKAQTSPVNLAPQGTIITAGLNTGSGGSPTPEVIRDGVKPAVGSTNSQQQYDTYNSNNQANASTYLIKEDWIGYQFTTPQTFTQVVFQEGIDFDANGQYDQYYGGWFSGPLQVQVRQGGVWVDVGAVSTPAYPGAADYISFNTYTLNFPATTGDAIRVYGVPGGGFEFISVGELEVYGYTDITAAGSSLVKVSGDFQEGVLGTTLSQPLTVQVYNNGAAAAGIALNFNVTSGGGSINALTATTDANGQASVNWQLGQSVYPQPQKVQVSGNGLNTVTFTARGTGVTRIMPIGDSITQGCCLPSYDGYRRPLWSALNNAGYSVNFVGSLNETYFRLQPTDDYDRNHEGHSGYRTDQILASISTWTQSAQPDVALIHLGTNDLYQGVSVSTAINNIGLIIDRLRAVKPNVKILLAKIQAVASGTAAFNQQIDTLAVQKTSASSPITVVDQNVGWNNSADTIDGTHPNAAGAQVMATNWLNGIASILSGGGFVAVTGVSVSPTSASVAVNATTQLTATVAPATATNKTVTWSSSNTGVATVSASGLVNGISAGSATITVTTQDGGKTATSAITVTAASVAVTGVSVSPASASVAVNTAIQLTATVVPANATNKNVTWSSSNTSIATVNASGLVTGKAAGSATMTATTQDGGKTATSAITVTAASVAVTGVNVSPAAVSVAVAATTQLTATVTPANATNQNVTWSSSNTSVATVNASGLVSGVAPGTATLTVTTQDGGKTATSAITVTTATSGGGGTLSGTGNSNTTAANLTTEGPADWIKWGDANLNRKAGVTALLSTYTKIGAGTANLYSNDLRPLSWTGGTPTATGTNNTTGVYIAGVGSGFSFTAPADTTTRTLTVHVGGWNSTGRLVAHLSDSAAADFVDVTAAATGQYDRNYVLSYKAASAGQTLTVSWTVSAGAGNVTLNGAALNGSGGGSVAVTGVSVSPTSASVAVNATTQLTAVVVPANATNQNVTWSSSNTSIATVNASGLVTGKAAGSATMTATTQDGGKTATSAITVTTATSGGGGTLSGTGNSNTTAANLTTEGPADWIKWGDANLNRKAGVTALLSTYTKIGAGTANLYSNDLRPLSWTGGTPTATGTNNTTGVYIAGVGSGFSFTAPANTTTRTLTVHVGGWNSTGRLVAHLSDSAAADFVDVTAAATGQYDRNYVLSYKAASAGQTLTVSWTVSAGAGNVTLNGAATLQ